MVKKTGALRIRVTEEEEQAFKDVAQAIGETKSGLLRKLVREVINQEIDLLTDEQSLLMVAIRQLVGIANNLNQITVAIHQGKVHRTVDEFYLNEVKNQVLGVKKELEVCIKKTKTRWVKNKSCGMKKK